MERNFFIFLFLDEKEVSWKSVGKYGWEFITNCVTGIFGLLESGFGYFLGSRLCVCVCVCFTTVCAFGSGCWLDPSVKAMVVVVMVIVGLVGFNEEISRMAVEVRGWAEWWLLKE